MWILTQNGKRILSTEGMEEINVADPAVGRTDFAVMIKRKTDGKPFALGFYHRHDFAMTVIENIFNLQSDFIFQKDSNAPGYIVIPPKTFNMPQDVL